MFFFVGYEFCSSSEYIHVRLAITGENIDVALESKTEQALVLFQKNQMNFMVPQQVNPIITCCYMYTEDIKGKSLAALPL